MHVTVDQEKCVGAGQCVFAAPEVFDQREDDGIVILLDENPPAEEYESTREAAHVCPALAIIIDE